MSETCDKTFVGFGFGAIQAGLFVYEAQQTGNFGRYVIAEVNADLVAAVREAGGTCTANIAHSGGVEPARLENIELLNPTVAADREALVQAIADSDEMATALPSVEFFDRGEATSVAGLLAEGFARRKVSRPTVIYTAENNNHAAEKLMSLLQAKAPADALEGVETLNTVIGKMSGVIERDLAIELGLVPLAGEDSPSMLVEEFNRILISQVQNPDYTRGIACLIEKPDLLPFEEAKLYGHNAIHALIGFLADLRVYETIAKAGDDEELMDVARRAFLDECGPALIDRHGDLGDALFTPEGWRDYAEDLLDRMVNPYLHDLTARVCRDPIRKLGYGDRLYGTMRLCLRHGVEPRRLGMGAAAGVISMILRGDEIPDLPDTVPADPSSLTPVGLFQILRSIWGEVEDEQTEQLIDLTWDAIEQLKRW